MPYIYLNKLYEYIYICYKIYIHINYIYIYIKNIHVHISCAKNRYHFCVITIDVAKIIAVIVVGVIPTL